MYWEKQILVNPGTLKNIIKVIVSQIGTDSTWQIIAE